MISILERGDGLKLNGLRSTATRRYKESQRFLSTITQPWVLAVLMAGFIPFFPEYISPFLAVGSLFAAYSDCKQRRSLLALGGLGLRIGWYIAFSAIGILYSTLIQATLSTVSMWIVMLTVYISLTNVLSTRHRLDTALYVVVLIGGLVAAIGVAQYMLNAFLHVKAPLIFWNKLDNIVYDWLPFTIIYAKTGLRVSSTFSNPNVLGAYLSMILPFAAYYGFHGKRPQWLPRICLVLISLCIAFTFSRGSYFALLAVTLIFFIANIRKIRFFLMSIASLLLLAPDSVLQRLLSVREPDNSMNLRMRIWITGIKAIGDHPVFGIGAGVLNTWELLLSNGINQPHMHNLALQTIIEGGIVALILLAIVGIYLLRMSLRLFLHSPGSRAIGVAFLAFAASFILIGMVDYPLLTPRTLAVFFMVLALADSAFTLYLNTPLLAVQDIFSRRHLSILLRKTDIKETGITDNQSANSL